MISIKYIKEYKIYLVKNPPVDITLKGVLPHESKTGIVLADAMNTTTYASCNKL